MTWMLTSGGQQVHLHDIALDTLRIDDIAHHLSLINRWHGATRRPCSVAEHSLLVCEILESVHGITSPVILMAGLMHDAHEAYCGDLSTPMKAIIGERWDAEEHRIQRAILRRFDLTEPAEAFAGLIKQADRQALATEWRDLVGLPQLMPVDLPPPISWLDLRTRGGMDWRDWRTAFHDKFTELAFLRALHEDAAAADGQAAPTYEGPYA